MGGESFNIVLICPPGYGHAMAFWEVGVLLEAALGDLGFSVKLQSNRFESDATNIVLGYHLLAEADGRALAASGVKYICYQLEQFSPESGWITPLGLDVLRGGVAVWEYARGNLAVLEKEGVGQVKYLPLGYHRKLESIRPLPEDQKTIDVLHYGSLNERRRAVLGRLRPHCRVEELMGVYGSQRDAAIARARLVLHIHYFQAKLAAQVRVSYLLNNGIPVVSEASEEEPFAGMIETVPYDQLVDRCLRLLAAPAERAALGARGQRLFRERPMVENLRRVLS